MLDRGLLAALLEADAVTEGRRVLAVARPEEARKRRRETVMGVIVGVERNGKVEGR